MRSAQLCFVVHCGEARVPPLPTRVAITSRRATRLKKHDEIPVLCTLRIR